MQINISARNTQLTPAINDDVHKRFQRLERQIGSDSVAHVVLTVDGAVHRAEARISDGNGTVLEARTDTNNMYTSINRLAQTLTRQWNKHKGTQVASHHGAESIRRAVGPA